MKLNINEVYFVQQAVASVSIKASDAPIVSELMTKLEKEFSRLQKLEEKKQPTELMEVAN